MVNQKALLNEARKSGQRITDNLVVLVAEGTAQGTERVADATRRTADLARDWANDVGGRNRRSRTIIGLLVGVVIGTLAAYLFWSSNGRKQRKKLERSIGEILDKVS